MIYLSYDELLALHVYLMRDLMGETYYGVLQEALLRSALARPQHAAQYEKASAIRQAEYLFQGLLMNHGFAQGNKRTAYLALEWFINRNDLGELHASDREIVQMCLNAENKKWTVAQIETWLRKHLRAA